MEFTDRLYNIAGKLETVANNINTEEATKNALIMPFIHSVLGFDVFNPTEVVPEFIADVGIKKGEKIDYALLKDNSIQILIECKKYGDILKKNHKNQLFRYFAATDARVAILTNGATYQFYTDLDYPNVMDDTPFLELNLEDIDEHVIPEVKKLTKESFDIESVLDSAEELKYLSQIKKVIEEQFEKPHEDFVRFIAAQVYDGIISQKVKKQFTILTKRALNQFIHDSVNNRLKTAIGVKRNPTQSISTKEPTNTEIENECEESKIVTTVEEIEAFNVVKAIFRQKIDVARVVSRDRQRYFGVLLDDNNRKPLCRFHFNTKQKYLGIILANKKEEKIAIDSIDEIFNYSEKLLATINFYQ